MKCDFDKSAQLVESPRISLVSGNAQLLELCREVVRELSLEHCDIVLVGPHQKPSPQSDLLIWDMDDTLKSRIDQYRPTSGRHQQLFLVSRTHLHDFLTDIPLGAGSTLLKPVNK